MTGDHYALDGLAVPDEIAVLHDLLDQVATEHPEVPAEDLMMFETAVMEIANNVVEHGVPPGSVRWQFTLDVGSALVARLVDSGQDLEVEWSGEMPDELAESGRGLALASTVLDELTHERQGPTNVWTMVRRLRD